MADLLGLIASALQLVDTVVTARGYIKDFLNAPNEQRAFFLEVQNLRPLLLELHRRFEGSDSVGTQHLGAPLGQLNTMLDGLAQRLSPAGLIGAYHRGSWPLWGKKEVQEGLKVIERFKSLISAWLGIDVWDATQQQKENHCAVLESIQNTATDQRTDHRNLMFSISNVAERQEQDHAMLEAVKDAARDLEDHQDRKQRDEIIEWWSSVNFFTRQADIFIIREPGTGEWFLASAEFKAWTTGLGNILWCPGIPGAGKTVLASVVVDYLREALALSGNIGVAAIYLNHKEGEIQTPSNLLASLWRQLVFRKAISPAVRTLYEKHREPRTRPSLESFYDILSSAVAEYSQVYLIVDALDEYPEENRNILLKKLSNLGQPVNLMFTSRPHINISAVFKNAQTIEIRATADDIRRYVDAQIAKSSRLLNHIKSRPDLGEDIETQIVGRSDGMFLLAKLHIMSLTERHTVKAVREALKNMPNDLQNTYDEVMARINQQSDDDRKLALSALSWISNAKRFLRVPELREALAVEPGTTALDPDNLLDMDIVLSVCAGLIIVDQVDGIVRLIHYTTQRYLDRIQASHFPSAQTDITAACMTYLSFQTFLKTPHLVVPQSTKNLQNRFPLLDYAVEYCLVHARGKPEVKLKDPLLQFLANASRWIYIWAYQYDFVTLGMRWSTTRLWIAAFFDLREIACYLMSIEETQDSGPALQAAVANGHHEMIRLLIENGADVNGSVLQVAAYFGYRAVVSLLIDKGADANEHGGKYGTALQAASAQGHEAVAQLLLDNGADVNVMGGVLETALHAAAAAGHERIVRLLLAHNADADAQDGEGTALYRAVVEGHEDVVHLLIGHGANVNIRGGSYGTTLQAAATKGNIEEVRTLIAHGADVNAKGGHWHTALLAASKYKHQEVVQILIENCADVNAYANAGSALYMASRNGDLESARLLIQHSADVNILSGDYNTALAAAADAGNLDLVRLLLENGADVNLKGGYGGSALCMACEGRPGTDREAAITLLLEHGADVNMLGRFRFGTALQAASYYGNRAAVRMLLANHADIDQLGGEFGTALQAACHQNEEEIARILVENGADVNLQGGEHGTALRAASFMGNVNLARLLIQHGANVDAKSEGKWGYRTALEDARWYGQKLVLDLLGERCPPG